MTVKYLGIKGTVKQSGCPVCGGKRKTDTSLQYSKSIMFPSGKRMVFLINQTYEVSEEEGQFLLRIKYEHGGQEMHPFALV